MQSTDNHLPSYLHTCCLSEPGPYARTLTCASLTVQPPTATTSEGWECGLRHATQPSVQISARTSFGVSSLSHLPCGTPAPYNSNSQEGSVARQRPCQSQFPVVDHCWQWKRPRKPHEPPTLRILCLLMYGIPYTKPPITSIPPSCTPSLLSLFNRCPDRLAPSWHFFSFHSPYTTWHIPSSISLLHVTYPQRSKPNANSTWTSIMQLSRVQLCSTALSSINHSVHTRLFLLHLAIRPRPSKRLAWNPIARRSAS